MHRCQGLTLEKVLVELGAKHFLQTYIFYHFLELKLCKVAHTLIMHILKSQKKLIPC